MGKEWWCNPQWQGTHIVPDLGVLLRPQIGLGVLNTLHFQILAIREHCSLHFACSQLFSNPKFLMICLNSIEELFRRSQIVWSLFLPVQAFSSKIKFRSKEAVKWEERILFKEIYTKQAHHTSRLET
ncbi:hypothetical protein SUGI_0878870 [Cryptomeria japonica]|nr:hypothetical protein SUGI_0878870 [Cryptomeria japonica]